VFVTICRHTHSDIEKSHECPYLGGRPTEVWTGYLQNTREFSTAWPNLSVLFVILANWTVRTGWRYALWREGERRLWNCVLLVPWV